MIVSRSSSRSTVFQRARRREPTKTTTSMSKKGRKMEPAQLQSTSDDGKINAWYIFVTTSNASITSTNAAVPAQGREEATSLSSEAKPQSKGRRSDSPPLRRFNPSYLHRTRNSGSTSHHDACLPSRAHVSFSAYSEPYTSEDLTLLRTMLVLLACFYR
jgi:hypothetical protein